MGRHERGDRIAPVVLGIAAFCWFAWGGSPPAAAQSGTRYNPGGTRRATPSRKKVDLRDRIAVVKDGTSSTTSQRASERMLAAVRMTLAQRKQVGEVLRDTSYFRELPTLKFEIDPRAYFYLAEQPDLTVALWRAMGISKFKIQHTGRNDYSADGGDGTKGTIEVLQRDPSHYVILCTGIFKSPFLLRGVKTKSVIHLQTVFARDKRGRTFVTHRAFTHVSFPSTTAETAAKMLSPIGNMVLDRNFKEISLFLHVMSLGMSRQPGWIERITNRMSGVSDAQKKGLLKVTAQVYATARSRETIPLFKSREDYLRELMRPLKTRTADKSMSDNRDGNVRRAGRAMN
jgi:hypothetical protein